MTEGRRQRAQVVGAVVAIALMLWALIWRDDPTMTSGHRVIGWAIVAALAGYVALVWRQIWRGRNA